MSGLGIFVSHSHVDDEFGQHLVSDLRSRLGEDAVWYDESGGLHGGEEWWNTIVSEVTSRDIFIIVLSPDSVNSKWVTDEINIAWLLKNRIGKRIIPILYRPCDIRADLLMLQYISFVPPRSYRDAFADLIQVLDIPQVSQSGLIASREQNPRAQMIQRLTQEVHAAFGQEDWDTMLAKCDLLMQEAPEAMTPVLWRERGLAYLSLRNGQAALASFNEAMKLDQFDVATLRGRAQAFTLLEMTGEAAATLDRAYTLAPFNDATIRLSILDDLVTSLQVLKRWDEALRRIDTAIRLVPGDAYWIERKLTALSLADRDSDVSALVRELALDHRELVNHWLVNRAIQYNQVEDWSHALAISDLAISLTPDDTEWSKRKIEILAKMGRGGEALISARELVQRPDATVDEWLILAGIALLTDNGAEVRSAVHHAEELAGGDNPVIIQARKDYLEPLELIAQLAHAHATRIQARRQRLGIIGAAVALLIIISSTAIILTSQAQASLRSQQASATAQAVAASTSIAAQATSVIATQTAFNLLSYSAAIPGPACDNGTGTWTLNVSDKSVDTVTCPSAVGGMVFTGSSNDKFLDEVTFNFPGHTIAKNFTIDVDIKNATSNSCSGVDTRRQSFGGYGFYICSGRGAAGGSIDVYNATTGTPTTLNNVTIASSALSRMISGNSKEG